MLRPYILDPGLRRDVNVESRRLHFHILKLPRIAFIQVFFE